MLDLRALEISLQNYLLSGNSEVETHLANSNPEYAKQRLGVYAYAYFNRLIEILAVDFPCLCQLLGREKFDEVALLYIKAYPSHYFSVRYIGENFSIFLKQHPSYAEHPYYAEIANFEWALVNTGDAADAPILTVADLSAIPQEQWGSLHFNFHPSLQLIDLSWNITELWQAAIQDQPMPTPTLQQPQSCRLWRQQVQSYYFVDSDNEARVLNLLYKGKNFAEVCELLCDWLPEEEVPAFVVNCLIRWLNEGIISTVKFSGE